MGGSQAGGTVEDLHDICPLCLTMEILHFPAQIGGEDFKDPSVRVLVCDGPWRTISTRDLHTHQLRIVPIKVKDDELRVDGGHEIKGSAYITEGGASQAPAPLVVCLPQRLPTKNCQASLSLLTLTCNGPKTRKKTLPYAFLTVNSSVRRHPVARPEF